MNLAKRKSNNPNGRPQLFGEKTTALKIVVPNSQLESFRELMLILRDKWKSEKPH